MGPQKGHKNGKGRTCRPPLTMDVQKNPGLYRAPLVSMGTLSLEKRAITSDSRPVRAVNVLVTLRAIRVVGRSNTRCETKMRMIATVMARMAANAEERSRLL